MNWLWVVVVLVGQVVSVAAVATWARSRPTERYPLGWVSRRTLRTRILLMLGAAGTFFGTLAAGFEIETPVMRGLIVLAGFAPTIAAIITANVRAKRRRGSEVAATNTVRTNRP